jgi:hypothetical protein
MNSKFSSLSGTLCNVISSLGGRGHPHRDWTATICSSGKEGLQGKLSHDGGPLKTNLVRKEFV